MADTQKSSESLLPAFYSANIVDLLNRPGLMDKANAYRWVKLSKDGENQALKAWKGWVPLTDPEMIKKFGLERLARGPEGTVRHMDTELWYRPKEVNDAVKAELARRLDAKRTGQAEALNALAEETKGRSKGRVETFVKIGQETPGDVLERVPFVDAKAKK